MSGIYSHYNFYNDFYNALNHDRYNVYDRFNAVKRLKDLWEYYSQTCKDCGPYHPETIAAHNKVYKKMFIYLMSIESTYTIFEECNNTYSRYRCALAFKEKLIDNTKVGPIETEKNPDEWPQQKEGLYFRINTYTTDEEDMYESIEASFVTPLITLKQSYTYNF